MIPSRQLIRRNVAAMAVLGALVLTGCGSTDGAATAATGASQAAETMEPSKAVEPTEAGVSEQGPAASLPEGFPGTIPLPDLPIASATALTTTKGWIVNFVTDDGPGDMKEAHTALAEAGFVDEYWAPENGTGLVTGEKYAVQVMLTPENSWISFSVRPPQ